jgi:hypothetical protein
MPSSGMLRLVSLVRSDVSGERIASSIRVARRSSETSVLTRGTRRNIPEDGIQHVDSLSLVCCAPFVL